VALGSFIGAGRSLGTAIRRVQRAEEASERPLVETLFDVTSRP
jgi:hypothetical protein